ncbi:MAG: oxidoreductase [Rhodobacteraceae bacterium]|nr:MAG: oxidoreductase [Paracoccaceae bacterium]
MTDHYHTEIVEISDLTERIKQFRLAAKPGISLPNFAPGSHIRVAMPDGDHRCYSLIDLPSENGTPDGYRIAVQVEPDGQGGSKYMHGLAIGDSLGISPPKNDFPLDDTAPAILIAGGIGVTPMISMATRLLARGQEFEFHYAGRSAGVMAYIDTLRAAFGARLALHFDDDPDTALNLAQIVQGIPDQHHLYFCGPPGMLEATKFIASAAGLSSDRIHFEVFATPKAQEGDQPFEVELSSTGQVFTIPPGKTIVEVLDEAGIDIMFDCQRGDCGICQTDVISGTPDHRDVILSDDERASGEVMQICVSRAKSPRLVLDI